MATLYFNPPKNGDAQHVSIESGESVLDALLREGISVPYGCKSGICQTCILQEKNNKAPESAQRGLRPQQIDQGLFLSCCCIPNEGETLDVCHADLSGQIHTTRVIEKTALNANVFRLRIEKFTDYHAGQFFTLWKDQHTARSYSAASVSAIDDFIEFHIKRIEGGAFSDWAWQSLSPGDSLLVQGPLGSCYYSDNDSSERPIFLSGIGTGLAPLIGVLRDTLHQGHRGKITLVLGNNNEQGFYLNEALTELHKQHTNLSVHLIAQTKGDLPLSNDMPSTIQYADIYHFSKESIGDFSNHKIFLCGAPSFVQKMKKLCFINGAKMSDIHADAFLPFIK